MSYRLIDSNNSEFLKDGFITQDTANEMPCIYADLPNGMDGGMYLVVPAHEGMTNGDMIKAMFPGCRPIEGTFLIDTDIAVFEPDWWKAPYKRTEG